MCESSSTSRKQQQASTAAGGVPRYFRNILSNTKKLRCHHPHQQNNNNGNNKKRVAFAVDRVGRVPSRNIHTYEIPLETEFGQLYYTEEELARISGSCEALAKENTNNQEYLSNLGRVVLNLPNKNSNSISSNNHNSSSSSLAVPGAEPLSSESLENSSVSTLGTSISTLSESVSTLNYSTSGVVSDDNNNNNSLNDASSLLSSIDTSALPASETLEGMRGLEFMLEDQVGAQRRCWVRSIVRYQQKLQAAAAANGRNGANNKTKVTMTDEERSLRLRRRSTKYSKDCTRMAIKFAEWDACEAARVHYEEGILPRRDTTEDNTKFFSKSSSVVSDTTTTTTSGGQDNNNDSSSSLLLLSEENRC